MRWTAAGTGLALALALGGCSGRDADPPGALDLVRVPGGGREQAKAGMSQGDVLPGSVLTFGSMELCAVADVTVTGVRLVRARGPMTLRRWAVVDARRISVENNVAVLPGPLESRRPLPSAGPAGLVRCVAGGGDGSMLLVEIRKDGPADGCAGAIDVDYTDGTRTGTYRVWMALGLTQAPAAVSAFCE